VLVVEGTKRDKKTRAQRSTLQRLRVIDVLESDLASVADLDVYHVPPAICDLAVVADVELNSVLAHAVQRDLGVAFLHEAAAERVHFVLVQPGPQRVHVDGLRAEAVGDVGVEGCGAVGALLVAVEHVAAGGREQMRVKIFGLLAPRQNHAQLARAQRPGDGKRAVLGAAVEHFHGLRVVQAFQASNVVNAHNVLASRDPELELAGGRRHHAAEHLLVSHEVDSGPPYIGSVGGLAHNTLQSAVELVQLGRFAVLARSSASTVAARGSTKAGSAVDAVLARLAVRSGGTRHALPPIVALGTGKAPGTNVSARARETVRTALAWLTLAAIFSRTSLGAGVARGAMGTHGTNVAFVAFDAFDTLTALRTNRTLRANGTLRAEKASGAGQAPRAHRADAAFRSTSSFVTLGPTGAFLAWSPVRARSASGTHRASCAGGTGNTRISSGALSAIQAVLARRSSAASETDEAGLAGSSLVALRAH